MIRSSFIELVLREVYGEQPSDDSSITDSLLNLYIGQGLAIAAKQCYKEAIQIDGIGYVNNSFYTTFSGLPIVAEGEDFLYKITLPQIPLGIGRNEAVATLQFVDSTGRVSYTAIPLSINQVGYRKGLRPIPNKIVYWPEGTFAVVETTLQLFPYTAKVKMISGGDPTNLNSILNVPDEYIPIAKDYCVNALRQERGAPKDAIPDGIDKP